MAALFDGPARSSIESNAPPLAIKAAAGATNFFQPSPRADERNVQSGVMMLRGDDDGEVDCRNDRHKVAPQVLEEDNAASQCSAFTRLDATRIHAISDS